MYDNGNSIIISNNLFLWSIIAILAFLSIILVLSVSICGKKSRTTKASVARLNLILKSAVCSVAEIVVTDTLTMTYASDTAFTLLGYSPDDFSDKEAYAGFIKSSTLSSDWSEVFAAFKKAAKEKGEIHCRCCAVKSDGSIIRIKVDGVYSGLNDYGKPLIEAVFADVTAAHDALTLMQRDKERYLKLLSIHDDFCFEYNFIKDIIYFSNNVVKIFNIPLAVSGFKNFIYETDMKTAENMERVGFFNSDTFSSDNVSTVKVEMRHADGTYHWYNIDFLSDCEKSGEASSVIGRGTDVTNEKNASDYMIKAARTDLMTGLYNKMTTEDNIVYELINSDSKQINAFVMLDIDNFKFVNDKLGHSAGDAIIVKVAEILKKGFSSSDIIGRVGGDEFIVFVKNLKTPDSIDVLLQNILDALNRIEITKDVRLSCSAGGECFKCNGKNNFEKLYSLADDNLYKSKENGKNCFTITKSGVE